jgi:hypothetical protein
VQIERTGASELLDDHLRRGIRHAVVASDNERVETGELAAPQRRIGGNRRFDRFRRNGLRHWSRLQDRFFADGEFNRYVRTADRASALFNVGAEVGAQPVLHELVRRLDAHRMAR